MARRPILAEALAKGAADSSPLASDIGEGGEEVTRCICGNEEFVSTPRTRAANANPGLFVQCEKCHVWQHGFCVGFLSEEDIPDEYYCEQCEPSYHNISMRHGTIVSRYRPVKHAQGSRSPRKSRPREVHSSARSSSDGDAEPQSEAASGSPAPLQNGGKKPSSASVASVANGKAEGHDGVEAARPSEHRPSNGSSAKQKQPSEKGPSEKQTPNKPDASRDDAGHRSPVPTSHIKSERPHPDSAPPTQDGDSPHTSKRSSPSPRVSREASQEPPTAQDGGQISRRDSKSDLSAEHDSKSKRNRRKNSNEDASSPTLNSGRSSRLKRRSREEEILQRVLEESAREARELEARRRSQDHDHVRDGGEGLGAGSQATRSRQSDDENKDENLLQPAKDSKRRRSNDDSVTGAANSGGPTVVDAENQDKGDEEMEALKGRKETTSRSTRQTRPARVRPGRKPGSRNQNPAVQQRLTAADKLAAGTTNARRTPNGVKKCRPRIPSPRSTFQEMRRRVANIIEFSTRTQAELAEEKPIHSKGPLALAAQGGELRAQLEQLATMANENMSTLEDLTRRLLSWEEQFGQK